MSCGEGRSNSKTAAKTGKDQTEKTAAANQKFTLPDIPATLVSPEERAKYLVGHYWDNFDFGDTSLMHRPEITEQAFVDFIDILRYNQPEDAANAEHTMLEKAMTGSPAMFAYFVDMYEKYLYDPNSPMMNEELFIPVLQYIVSSDKVGEFEKIRPAHQLEMALKNRKGSIATDFTYTLASGAKKKLSGITTEYTLLMFYNPDCESCRETKRQIVNSPVINANLHRMTILAIYPDKDVALWKKSLADTPAGWTVGYDDGELIRGKEVYDLKAIPTLYLLDRNKKVLLKDAPVGMIEEFLVNLR